MRKQIVSFHNPHWAFLIALGLLALLFLGLTAPAHGPTVAAQTARAVDQAAIEVVQTVGTSIGICASTQAIALTSGTAAYYCVTLRNTGTVPLTKHTLFDPVANVTATLAYTITPNENPGETNVDELHITATMLNAVNNPLIQTFTGSTAVLTHTVIVTSTNMQGDVAVGQAIATVVRGTVGMQLTKTVGLTDKCASTTALAVNVNTLVKYCLTVKNTGTLPLVSHHLYDPFFNVNVHFNTEALAPNQSLVITNDLSALGVVQRLQYTAINEITNTIFFTSATKEGAAVTGQARALTVMGQTSTTLTNTLSLDATQCGTKTALDITSGRPVYHCLQLKNTGSLPLDTHTIQWVQPPSTVQLLNRTITQTLSPGQTLLITSSKVAELAQASVTASAPLQTHVFTVTSRTSRNLVTVAQAQSQMTVGTQTLSVTKYAMTNRTGCTASSALNIVANQDFYYCLVLVNNGQVPLVRHTFSEGATVNISGAFTYTVAPGQRITLTNYFLTSTLGLPALLGPFRAASSFSGITTVNSYSNANVPVAQSVAFQVNVTALTATPTTPPTAIPTFTPTITPSPSPSPTLPPTLTPSPVVVSFLPTPTQPFGISAVTTPTPAVLAGAVPVETDAFGQPISPFAPPTVDVTSTLFALTAEAAATQTVLAFIPPPVVDTPTPVPTDTPFVPSPLATPTLIPPTPVALVTTPLPIPSVDASYLAVATQVFQASTATLGWIWFAVGSIVFFAAAGMFAGLSWRQQAYRSQGVYDMDEAMQEDNTLVDDPPIPVRPSAPSMASRATPSRTARTQPPHAKPAQAQSDQPRPSDDEDYWPPSLR